MGKMTVIGINDYIKPQLLRGGHCSRKKENSTQTGMKARVLHLSSVWTEEIKYVVFIGGTLAALVGRFYYLGTEAGLARRFPVFSNHQPELT